VLNLAEIGPAVFGAWRLAQFDAGGMRYFDQSLRGFWRSFRVAVLVAPLYALLVYFDLNGAKGLAGWFSILVGESIGYVINWTAFPLLMFYLCEAIDRRDRYLGFIVAYNWSSVIQLAVMVPALAIDWLGILPHSVTGAILIAANIALAVYEWFIVRTALNLSPIAAVAITGLDQLVLASVILMATNSMIELH
jgi:hypothetical protein